MLGWILLAIGLVGFGATGWLDLKTTEFPDWIPYAIIVAALVVRGAYAWLLSDLSIIVNSIAVGLLFLAIGMAMYYTKQWGDGDAWLLGALGFLFPDPTGFAAAGAASPGFAAFPFPAVMLFNFFFISFFYLIIYSLALGLRSPKVSGQFFRYLKGNARSIVPLIVAFAAFCAGLFLYMYTQFGAPFGQLTYVILFPVLFAVLVLFLHYGKFIENKVFKRRIDAKKLRAGDVPIGSKWKVLTEKEVRALKRKGGKIWIKEGVRFAPVFVITLVLTLFMGNLMLMLLGL
jgi:hypothetical protein